jgi:hypothetical protein
MVCLSHEKATSKALLLRGMKIFPIYIYYYMFSASNGKYWNTELYDLARGNIKLGWERKNKNSRDYNMYIASLL